MVLPGACDECWQAVCCWLQWAGWARSGTACLVPGAERGRPGSRGEACGPVLLPWPPWAQQLGERWPPPPLPCGDNGGRDLGLCKAQVSGNVSSLRAPGAASCSAPRGAGLGCGVCGRGSRWGPQTRALQSALPPGSGVPCVTGAAGPSYFPGVGPGSGPGLGGGPGGPAVRMGFWRRQVGVGFMEEGRRPAGWGPLKVRQAGSPATTGQGPSCCVGSWVHRARPARGP